MIIDALNEGKKFEICELFVTGILYDKELTKFVLKKLNKIPSEVKLTYYFFFLFSF